MIKGKIEFTGATVEDISEAITEALDRIVKLDMTSGFDRNSTSSFTFELFEEGS